MILNTVAYNDRKVPQFATDGMGNVIGYAGADSNVYPLVFRPVEILKASAVKKDSTVTGSDEILDSFSILANTLGPSSLLQIEPVWTFSTSANNKILKVAIGSTNIYSATRTTSTKEAPLILLANRNSLNSQIQPYDYTGYAVANSTAPTLFTIDFSVNVTLTITGQRANAGDTLSLEYYRVLHFIGD